MNTNLSILAMASLIALPNAAIAGDGDTMHDVSLTISPVHLILPVVELQGEFKLNPKMSASAILGFGKVSDEDNIINATVFELGGQFSYYLIGDFDHGMQLGAEVLFVHLSDTEATPGGVFGGGLSVGPYVGYKIAADFGLTFAAQLGVAFLAVRASTDNSSASEERIAPLLNINLGWSF